MNITCKCKICKANAAKLGVESPLTATVSSAQGQALAAKNKHFLVHAAFDPSALGRSTRKQYAVEPIGYAHKTDAQVRVSAADAIAAVRARNGN
jgi:hypothetical protein